MKDPKDELIEAQKSYIEFLEAWSTRTIPRESLAPYKARIENAERGNPAASVSEGE